MKINVLSFFLTTFFLFTVLLSPVWAQEVSPTVAPTSAPFQYQLPYPGILPGHPFYFLKVFRDNMAGFFISNPLKKAEFNLLQADKTIATSQYLFNQKKDTSVVIATIVKAENYFSEALNKTEEAKKQGMDSKDILKRLHVANLKYQEVIRAMTKTATGDDSKKFASELEKIQDLGKKTK